MTSHVSLIQRALTVWRNATGRRRLLLPAPDGPPEPLSEPEPLPEPVLTSPLVLAAALDRRHLVGNMEQLLATVEEVSNGSGFGLVAGSVMSATPITVGPAADWRVLSNLFVDHGFRNVPVVDAQGLFLGLIPLRTILRPGAQALSARHLLQEAATRPPEATLAELLPPLLQDQTAIPVVEADGRLVGMVTRSDIVAALVRRSIEPLIADPAPALASDDMLR